MKTKKQPERTCIGCKTERPKREMLRIVCNKDGEIFLDRTGKAAGRGAYICPNADCLTKCIKSHMIEKAFSRLVDAAVYKRLEEELNSIEQ